MLQELVAKLCDRSWLMATLMPADASPDTVQHLTREAATLAVELQHPTASRQRQAVQRLVERITIRRDGLTIEIKSDPLGCAGFDDEDGSGADRYRSRLTIEIKARFVRKEQDLHLIVSPTEGADFGALLGKSLIKAIARAVTWYDELVMGRVGSIRDIAAAENVSERYVAQLLPLAMINPDLIEGALDGTGEWSISGSELARGAATPVQWKTHETAFASY